MSGGLEHALAESPTKWVDLCVKDVLLPGHVAHLFICTPVFSHLLMFDLVASFVSALNLHHKCPPTLRKALADTHPDSEVWLQSYKEEKGALQSLNTYRKITLREYCALCKRSVLRAIPTKCILRIKRDKNFLPQCAKSQLVILGNYEDRLWSKSKKFALVLCGNLLCFLVSGVQKCRMRLVRVSSLLKRSLLSDHPLVIPMWTPKNIGFSCKLSMVYAKALDTGMTK
jgi:hypothetical protein